METIVKCMPSKQGAKAKLDSFLHEAEAGGSPQAVATMSFRAQAWLIHGDYECPVSSTV